MIVFTALNKHSFYSIAIGPEQSKTSAEMSAHHILNIIEVWLPAMRGNFSFWFPKLLICWISDFSEKQFDNQWKRLYGWHIWFGLFI